MTTDERTKELASRIRGHLADCARNGKCAFYLNPDEQQLALDALCALDRQVYAVERWLVRQIIQYAAPAERETYRLRERILAEVDNLPILCARKE